MKKDYSISIYLDTRRAKDGDKYPVKLRVYTSSPRKQKLYPTIFDLTEKEFNQVWNTAKPRAEFKPLRRKLQAIEHKAHSVADKITPFNLELFEKHLYRNVGDGVKIKYHYQIVINNLKSEKRLGTASSYELSEKAIERFVEMGLKKDYDQIVFNDITPDWLRKFEKFLIEKEGKSPTTVGIYGRTLKAVFNKAIDEKEIDRDLYPFGKRKYQLPAKRNVRKALSSDQLKTLFESKPKNKEQKKAKDFWFFSYACNGMNVKDISLLTYKDIEDDKIVFYRAKTKLTSKGNLRPITVHLNDFTRKVINAYGNKNNKPSNLIFPIVRNPANAEETQRQIKNFTRFINQHLKRLCKEIGLPEDISTYWARHSFATQSVRKGASLEFMRESLGHKDITTTQGYFAGFDDETRKEFAKTIMEFD